MIQKAQVCHGPRISVTRRRGLQVNCILRKGPKKDTFDDVKIPEVPAMPKIVLIGGTGRVGSSTASALLNLVPNAELVLGSRTEATYQNAVDRRKDLANTKHVQLDINDSVSIEKALEGADLVIHSAGPFQRKKSCSVLEAAIKCKVPYMDVCDDTEYSQKARRLHDRALEANIAALTTAGIYPGISNAMAAYMIEKANVDASSKDDVEGERSKEARRVLYSYFTAGSGGAGPTILETTFLLAGEPVVAYKYVGFVSFFFAPPYV